jgi:hypothetical protein
MGIAQPAVLVPVDLGGLPQDLDDLRVELCRWCGWPCRRRGLRAGAVQCDGADPDIPAAHSFSDTTRKPASAVWWRTRKRAIVTWSGSWLAASTRKARSSVQRRSICRQERTPMR